MEYEPVIGLEVHIQLKTESKMFCASSAEYGALPNELCDPLTMGLPGALPVPNKRAVEFAIMLGLATGCSIRRKSRFARKHYFYPDLPKGYQISQYDEPICEHGRLTVRVDNAKRQIGIIRIHIEEDAGKNVHDIRTKSSLLDLNRAGVPLLEIVSEPSIRSSKEAGQYLRTLRQLVRYLGICDGNMEEGSLRCDANVSVRRIGETRLGTRTEIKNLNSFKFVEKALEYEIARQISVLREGKEVVQETRLFDSDRGVTIPMRGKEESSDYRYFPDPDLPPLIVEDKWIAEIETSMPILPEDALQRLTDVYGLSLYDASILTEEKEFVEYFERANSVCEKPKAVANWMITELFGLLNKEAIDIKDSKIAPEDLGKMILLIEKGDISGKIAKIVFEEMFKTGRDPEEIVNERDLRQITDEEVIRQYALKVLDENKAQVDKYLSGNERLFGFFVGQAMKLSNGKLNPRILNDVLKEELSKLKR